MPDSPDADVTRVPSFDERRFEWDAANKKRELDLKEREIAAKEREVASKEVELNRSRWLNPTVIGLFVAALGLIGSIVVARINNSNTQDVERGHSQSSLILEAIKTGNSDAACKNLLFFVGLGLLDDTHRTIKDQCASASSGPPSLPSGSTTANVVKEIHGTVLDSSGKPIAGAEVRSLAPNVFDETNSKGGFIIPVISGDGISATISVTHPKFIAYIGAIKIADGTPITIVLTPRSSER